MKKRILSLVLALSMMISLFPVSALAQTPGGGTAEMAEENGTTYDGPLEIDNDPASERYGKPVADQSKWFDEPSEDTYNYGYKGDGWVYYSWYDRLVLEKGTWDFNYAKPADSSGDRLAEVKCNVTVGKNAVVTDGNFAGYVNNAGMVKDGTYKKPVINLGTIADGVFDSTVQNTGGRLGAHGLANLDESSENTYGTISGGLFTGGKSGVNWVYNNDQATITGGVFMSSISYDSGHTRGTITGGVFNNYASGAADGTDFQIRAYNNKGSQYSSSDGKIEIKTAEISDYVDVGSAAWVVLTKNADGAVINPVKITAQLFDKDGKLVEITNINGKPVGEENCDSSYVGDDKKTVQLTMPASDVKLNKPFNLNVIGGNIRVDWNLDNATEAQIPEKTDVMVKASSLVEEPFKEWQVAEGTTTPTGFADGYSLTTNPTKFAMPAGDVTLTAKYYSTTLNMKSDGTPDISNAQSRAEEMSTVYYGKNWEYTKGLDGTPGTLTLTGGTWDFTHYNPANTNTTSFNKAVACYVVINGATVSGGTFANDVWNNGTISGGIFEKTVSNTTGTITGGVFVNKPTGEGTISAGYTLKVDTSSAPNGMLTFVKDGYYDSLKTEIPSAYVVPSDTYKPVISVAGKDVNGDEIRPDNWSVTVNNDPQIKLSQWKGATLLGGTYTLNPGKVENGATVMLHKTKDVYALTVDGGTITSTTGTIDEGAKSGSFEKDTVVTVTAAAPESGKYFAGWTLEDSTTLPDDNITSQNGLNNRELTFKMPANEVHLKASYKDYDKTLAFDGSGDVITTDREPDGKGGYQGTGWTLSSEKVLTILKGTKLDLNGATVNSNYTVVIKGGDAAQNNASITNAIFGGVVTNSGNAERCYFKGSRLYNVGTISNSTINVDELAGGENYRFCLFSQKYSGLSNVRSLTTRNGENTITARLEEAGKYPVTGTTLYFTNAPKLGVSVNDASGTVEITNVNGDKSYAITKESEGYYTFTAPASGDVILNDAVKYTLTVTNGTIKVGEETKESPATLAEDTVVTVTAAAPESGKYFAGWTVSDGVTLKGADDEKIDLTDKTLTFQMPTSNVTLTATYEAYETKLEINDNGEPVTTNREPVYEDGKVVGYKGTGWTYSNGTLTLSGAFAFAADANTSINCSVVVERDAKLSNAEVVGSNATVTNNGTITNCCFGNPGVTVINNGEISNSFFATKPNGTGTLSGCLFASNEGLTEGHWTVDLKYSDGETAYAGLQDNPFKMSVNKFYVIADASGELPTIKLSKNASNGSLPAQVTVTAPDGAQWTQNIGDTDSFDLTIEQPTYKLTLVNAELVGMTGTEFTENATIKIKPKFTDEEFELDCWTSETTGFDVSSIYANGDGTYNLKMPGNALTLTANGRKKTYRLTVVNGVIGDENGTQNSGEYAKDAEITLTQKVPEDKVFTGWELSDGLTLVDGYKLTNTTIKVTMPGNAATAKATYKDKAPTTYTLTVEDGYIGTDENQTSGNYEAGATIKLTAKDAAEGKQFEKWELTGLTLKNGYQEANATIEVTINSNATAKATYKDKTVTPTPNPDDQPKTYTITTDIYGEVNGGASATVKENDWVHMTVAEVPEGMTFDYWNIPDALLKALQKQNSGFRNNVESLSFQMPNMGEEEQTFAIKANFRSSELPGEDDGPSALGTMATVAVGGAAAGILVWQGVSLGVDSYLQLNLPKGVAVPANRRELVVLLWETAGKPEAALPSLYSDVPAEEIELQKATRWAIDNGLVKPADDSDASRFDPDRYVTKYDVFGAWLKLKKLMK